MSIRGDSLRRGICLTISKHNGRINETRVKTENSSTRSDFFLLRGRWHRLTPLTALPFLSSTSRTATTASPCPFFSEFLRWHDCSCKWALLQSNADSSHVRNPHGEFCADMYISIVWISWSIKLRAIDCNFLFFSLVLPLSYKIKAYAKISEYLNNV